MIVTVKCLAEKGGTVILLGAEGKNNLTRDTIETIGPQDVQNVKVGCDIGVPNSTLMFSVSFFFFFWHAPQLSLRSMGTSHTPLTKFAIDFFMKRNGFNLLFPVDHIYLLNITPTNANLHHHGRILEATETITTKAAGNITAGAITTQLS